MIEVKLTEPELLAAANLAVMRQIYAMRKNYVHRYGDKVRAWTNGIFGCFGEMAVAKHLDKFWSGTVGQIDQTDVGDFEVRYNSYGDYLRVYEQDKPEKKYILVSGEPPVFQIMGWLYGVDGMLPEYKKRPPGNMPPDKCFWVPVDKLRPMGEL